MEYRVTPCFPAAGRHRIPERPTVVLLHGLGSDSSMWDALREHLAGRCDFITVDLPGHGVAPTPDRAHPIPELGRLLHDELESRAIRRVAVIGTSLGGALALEFALRAPDMVANLVLADTAAWYPPSAQRGCRAQAKTAARRGMAAIAPKVLGTWFTPKSIANGDTAVDRARAMLLRTHPQGFVFGCDTLADIDYRGRLRDIQPRTLVVCGAAGSPALRAAAATLAGNIRDSTLAWIPEARDGTAMERPRQFAGLVGTFLALPRAAHDCRDSAIPR